MTTFRAALTQLSAMPVTGVDNRYDIHQLPDYLPPTDLPALLIIPIELDDKRIFQERVDSLGVSAFSGGATQVSYTLRHLLLVAPRGSGLGISARLPQLVAFIDSYMAALAADPTLGDKLRLPAEVAVEPGIFAYAERDYYGCAFRHRWTLETGA